MKKFGILISIGLAMLFVLDLVLGKTLEHFYFTQESGLQYRTTYSMEETEAEVLIFGSSRATHHYDTRIISDVLETSVYNTGRDGHFIFYYTAVLKSILKRYTPKMIILDFTGTFANEKIDYDRLSILLPYYRNHPEIRNILLMRSKFEKVKLLSRTYRYNSMLTTIAVGNMEFNKERDVNLNYNGFLPLNGMYEKQLDSVETSSNYDIDDNKIKAFKEFLMLSKENNIPILVCNSPIYYLYDNDYTLEICREICGKIGVPFIDFSKDRQFLTRRDLFDDESHLNVSGAKLYTHEVLEIIERKKIFSR